MKFQSIVPVLAVLILALPNMGRCEVTDCCLVRGDVDRGGGANPINVADITYLVDFLFNGGPYPECAEEADVDAGGGFNPINVADVTWLVGYLFLGGPPPTPCSYLAVGVQEITLAYGETVFIDSLNVEMTFESIVDYRCPTQVLCFWEGAAEVGLQLVYPPSDTHHVVLSIMGGIVGTIPEDGFLRIPIDVLGCRFTLVQLLPYPVHPDSLIADSEYVATLLVEPDPVPPPLDGEVMMTSSAWVRGSSDDFELDSVSVHGSAIDLYVAYSGGCRNHDFSLYMSPGAFHGADPREANLYLRHFADGDMCEAYIQRHLQFNLQPLLDLYIDIYGQLEVIQLNVGGIDVFFIP